jgi:succinoglycan biosynthesis protein ExoA
MARRIGRQSLSTLPRCNQRALCVKAQLDLCRKGLYIPNSVPRLLPVALALQRDCGHSVKPLVSIIVPAYNEAEHIATTLRSLLAQSRALLEFEILVIDGGSSDDTVVRVTPFLADTRVKLLGNPARSAPAAFNLGLHAATGEYVCILGAHASYSQDYLEQCYLELLAHDAVGCSGQVMTVPANDSTSAKLAAWCLGNAFASSTNSVRTHAAGFAQTIPYPLFRKAALLDQGGYNELLVRNQDNDINQRLRAAGHRLYLTAKTQATYFARANVKSLCSYAFRTGKWNALTLRINPACMKIRHFVPLLFVIGLAGLVSAVLIAKSTHHPAALPLLALSLTLAGHLLFGSITGIQTAIRERSIAALLLPLVILGFHLAYGLGTLAGVFSLSRRAFSRPTGRAATLSANSAL